MNLMKSISRDAALCQRRFIDKAYKEIARINPQDIFFQVLIEGAMPHEMGIERRNGGPFIMGSRLTFGICNNTYRLVAGPEKMSLSCYGIHLSNYRGEAVEEFYRSWARAVAEKT